MPNVSTSSSKKVLLHSTLVILALAISYFIAKTPLSEYSLQISGLLVAIYMLISFLIRKKFLSAISRVTFDIFVFSFAASFLLFTTGGFTSPIFFLTYFLLFGVALLSGPITSIVAAVGFTILFILTPRTDYWAEILQIASLLSIAPISAMFGKQYIQILKDGQKIQVLKNVSQDFMEEIKEEKEEINKWTEGDFRLKLVNMQKNLSEMSQDSSLSDDKKTKIKELYEQIYELFLSGMEMKKDIGK